jgi:hypothetical protein
MSIAGYFRKRGYTELRIPKTKSDLGIQFDSPVLTGEKSVEQQQREAAIRATSPLDESYKTVEDYDPVLRAHCRLYSGAGPLSRGRRPRRLHFPDLAQNRSVQQYRNRSLQKFHADHHAPLVLLLQDDALHAA